MSEPKVLYVQRPVVGGVWDFQPADDSEVLAHIRSRVESGTIKGLDRDSLSHALDVLRHGRETHVQWIDYLENENPDFDTQHVGDVEHHRWYLTGYDPAIALLELFIGAVSDGGSET